MRERRPLSVLITEASSRRSSSDSVSDPRPPAAAVIAVRGERRSWETERRIVVFTTFERRSAFVSITWDSSSSRLRTAATRVSSPGTTRSWSASSTAGSVLDGTSTVPMRLPSTISGSARRRWSLSTQPSSMATEGRSNVLAMRWLADRSDSSTLDPLSSTRASSADRSASFRRRSASSARLRAAPARLLVTVAATRKVTSATQLRSSAIVNRPVGGMWKKLKASALITAVPSPIHRPQ